MQIHYYKRQIQKSSSLEARAGGFRASPASMSPLRNLTEQLLRKYVLGNVLM